MNYYENKFRFFFYLLFLKLIFASTKTSLNDDDKRVFSRNFGDNKNFLIDDCIPLAFGDFNADKIVDIFCRNTIGNTIRVMLNDDRSPTSRKQYQVNITYRIYLILFNMILQYCFFSSGIIYDALAGDFDGDSKLDLFILYKVQPQETSYRGGFLWGDRVQLSK